MPKESLPVLGVPFPWILLDSCFTPATALTAPAAVFSPLAVQTFWTLLVGAGSIVYTVGYILLLYTTVNHQQKSPRRPARQPLLGIAPDFHISNEQKYSKQSKTEWILAPCPLTYIFNVQETRKSYSWGWLVFVGLGLGGGGEFSMHSASSTNFNKCFKPQRSLSLSFFFPFFFFIFYFFFSV